MKGHPLPTESELEILSVLWKRERATVREVKNAIDAHRPVGYTTVLKLLQIMTDKGLVYRDTSARTHVYEAADPPHRMRKQLLSDLVDRAFGGSRTSLVAALFDEDERLSKDDFLAMYEQVEKLRRAEAEDTDDR